MKFYIQANNPKVLKEYNAEDESIADAMETIFPLYTESATLMWNHISIPLSYKYDISYMLDDVLELLESFMQAKNGKRIIHWLPDTFRSDWEIVWEDGQMEINSYWESVAGSLENLLNANARINLKITEFMAEWKQIFHIVLCALKENGYTERKIFSMEKLEKQYEAITKSGLLYQG